MGRDLDLAVSSLSVSQAVQQETVKITPEIVASHALEQQSVPTPPDVVGEQLPVLTPSDVNGSHAFEQETNQAKPEFDGARALADVEFQVSLGPRIPGTPGHDQIVRWMIDELEEAGWGVEVQEAVMLGHEIKNVVARRDIPANSNEPWIILGAHYDTRIFADQDPDPANRALPVPGANDGGSGVAVLLELARVLPPDLSKEVWLVFFDAEDNGNIPGWDWILGSRAFVEQLEGKPDAAIIVDMVGDAELDIYMERGSDQELSAEIWGVADDLGYLQFIPTPKYNILDDHVPFLEAGIRAVDIIDFDYPYWHTIEDTPDKLSAESLNAVGETLLVWLIGSGR